MRWPQCMGSLLLLQLVIFLIISHGRNSRAGAESTSTASAHAPDLVEQQQQQPDLHQQPDAAAGQSGASSNGVTTKDKREALNQQPLYQHRRQQRQLDLGTEPGVAPQPHARLHHRPRRQQQQQQQETAEQAAERAAAQQAAQQPGVAPRTVFEPRAERPASKIISVEEQLQQAEALGRSITQQELLEGLPLLGRSWHKPPGPRGPSDWPDGYVAICTIVKNQHEDLREWIEYHRYIGAQKIYVYDNNSTVPLASSIADHLHSGLVEYSYLVGRRRTSPMFRTSPQWTAYNDCVARYRHRHRWLAFIDADEFIVFHNASKPTLNEFMADYEAYGGLALNWVIFGSSGHKRRPAGGVLINYTKCLPLDNVENNHVKVIANTRYLLTIGDDPHTVLYASKDKYTVNEVGMRVTGAKSTIPSQKYVGLYHYLTKSEAEYGEKMTRGSAAGLHKTMDFFNAINDLANSTCTHAVQLGFKCCQSVHADLAGLS